MGRSNKLLNFIKYSNFSEDNINYLMEDTGKNITQLIRDSFELIKTFMYAHTRARIIILFTHEQARCIISKEVT